jgi:hypothetical protein
MHTFALSFTPAGFSPSRVLPVMIDVGTGMHSDPAHVMDDIEACYLHNLSNRHMLVHV